MPVISIADASERRRKAGTPRARVVHQVEEVRHNRSSRRGGRYRRRKRHSVGREFVPQQLWTVDAFNLAPAWSSNSVASSVRATATARLPCSVASAA
jgi:hypothetical protein